MLVTGSRVQEQVPQPRLALQSLIPQVVGVPKEAADQQVDQHAVVIDEHRDQEHRGQADRAERRVLPRQYILNRLGQMDRPA